MGLVSCTYLCIQTDAEHECRHTAAPPTAYGTVLNYVTLRLLGMGPDEGPMPEIRGLIHSMGGPAAGKVSNSGS